MAKKQDDWKTKMMARSQQLAGKNELRRLALEAAHQESAAVDTTVWVPLDQITVDERIQVRRGGLNPDTVQRYAVIMFEAGTYEPFPPAILYRDGETLWLAAGFHRRGGVELADQMLIEDRRPVIGGVNAIIRPGGFTDAYWAAVTDNLTNGLELKTPDLKEALCRLLGLDGMNLEQTQEYISMSDRQLAAILGVSNKTIGRWRKEFEQNLTVTHVTVSTERTYVTKHGTPATMKTGNIRKAARQRAQKPGASGGRSSTRPTVDPGIADHNTAYEEETAIDDDAGAPAARPARSASPLHQAQIAAAALENAMLARLQVDEQLIDLLNNPLLDELPLERLRALTKMYRDLHEHDTAVMDAGIAFYNRIVGQPGEESE